MPYINQWLYFIPFIPLLSIVTDRSFLCKAISLSSPVNNSNHRVDFEALIEQCLQVMSRTWCCERLSRYYDVGRLQASEKYRIDLLPTDCFLRVINSRARLRLVACKQLGDRSGSILSSFQSRRGERPLQRSSDLVLRPRSVAHGLRIAYPPTPCYDPICQIRHLNETLWPRSSSPKQISNVLSFLSKAV